MTLRSDSDSSVNVEGVSSDVVTGGVQSKESAHTGDLLRLAETLQRDSLRNLGLYRQERNKSTTKRIRGHSNRDRPSYAVYEQSVSDCVPYMCGQDQDRHDDREESGLAKSLHMKCNQHQA